MKKRPTGIDLLRSERLEQLLDRRQKIQKLTASIEKDEGIASRHKEADREEYYQKKTELIEKSRERLCKLEREGQESQAALEFLRKVNPFPSQLRNSVLQQEFFFASKKEDWDRAKDNPSAFIELQRMHTNWMHRSMPKREGFYGKISYHDLPGRYIVMDPTRIPHWYLQALKVADYPENADFKMGLYITWKAIPRYKAFCDEHIEELSDFGKPKRNRNPHFLLVHDHHPEVDGVIIHPRSNPSKGHKEPQLFYSAYPLLRMYSHMEEGQEREKKKLDRSKQSIAVRQKHLGAIGADQSASEKSKARKTARDSLHTMPDYFKGVRVKPKKQAREAIQLTRLRDRRGQINPGAGLARLTKAKERIVEREKGIGRIDKSNKKNRKQLEAVIKDCEASLVKHLQAFRGALLGRATSISAKHKNLPDLRMRPFNLYARKIAGATSALRKKSIRPSDQKELAKAIAALRLFQVERDREGIVDRLNQISAKTSLNGLMDFARDLYRSASNQINELFADYPDPKKMSRLIGIFELIHRYLENLAAELHQKVSDGADPEELHESLKQGLKGLDFSVLLDQI